MKTKLNNLILAISALSLLGLSISATALDVNSPQDNITAWVKLDADISGKEVLRFGHLMAYGQPAGEKSRKLFQLISLTKKAYRKLDNGDFESRTWGCGLYADAETGEIIDEFKNPYNDRLITLKPYCSNISGSVFSVKNGMSSTANFQMDSTVFEGPYLLDWTVIGDKATVSRPAATKWLEKSSGKTKYETSVDTYYTKMSDLNNPELNSVDAPYQYTLTTEWMTMLGMGERPGYMLWVGDSTKHFDLSEIPVDFLTQFKKRLGEEKLLRPLWDEPKTESANAVISKLKAWWPGDYDNKAQVATLRAQGKPVWLADDTGKGGHIQVVSHYRNVDLPQINEHVLYVEETKHNDPSSIFRQRLYTLNIDESSGLVRIKLFYFNDKEKYVGAWRDLDRLNEITPDELFASPDGCDLLVRPELQKYHMKMDSKACVFGKRYFDYQVLLGENSFWFRDKIHNVADDSIVSMAGDFTYHELDRVTDLAAPATMGSKKQLSEQELAAQEKQQKLGKRAFIRCQACHSLGEGEEHRTGPNLYGLFGSVAGKRDGFSFSDALVNSEIKWDESSLRAWLKSPATYIPGNKMAFGGVPTDKEMAALLNYLKEETQSTEGLK